MKVNALMAKRLSVLRTEKGLSRGELEQRLLLGDGWLELIESGSFPISVDFLHVMLQELGTTLQEFFEEIRVDDLPAEIDRQLSVVSDADDVVLHFPYGGFDARYTMKGVTMDQVEEWFSRFRSVLRTSKTDAVTQAFLDATARWPHINPADLWNFLIHQAYCDTLNHPPTEARLDFEQSWKRTAGWALERVIVDFYNPYLVERGVHLEIATGARKTALVEQLTTDGRVEADKIDVFLIGDGADEPIVFGAVHVKASFAERRTDDVPLSQALIRAGFTSPLVTLDCKATPSATPYNKGELGELLGKGQRRTKRQAQGHRRGRVLFSLLLLQPEHQTHP